MKSKNVTAEYAPWELEKKESEKRPERKGMPVQNRRANLHSKPKLKDQDFLEMYILSREKERLEKYGRTLGRRVKFIASAWRDAKVRMYQLNKTSAQVNEEGIEDLIMSEQEKKNSNTIKKQGNTTKIDWHY
jgi:hypothetical protein